MLLLATFVQMLDYLIDVVIWVLIAQFILGLLISFNVINTRNDAVVAIYRGLNALLDPLLGPIRRVLPNTGAMDFSPMVLLVILRLLQILLSNVLAAGY